MARAVTTQHKTIATAAAWIVALLIFFPILYTIITSFKSEQEAIQGFNLIPSGTFESYSEVQQQSGYFKFFFNSGDAWRVTRNTALYNIAFIVVNNVIQICAAILLFEVAGKWFRKIVAC